MKEQKGAWGGAAKGAWGRGASQWECVLKGAALMSRAPHEEGMLM